MLSNLWESTKWSAHLFFRIGYSIGLIWTGLSLWLREFALVDKWVFQWLFPRVGLFLLGVLITPLPGWLLVLLMFAPPGLVAGVIFFSFLGALIHF